MSVLLASVGLLLAGAVFSLFSPPRRAVLACLGAACLLGLIPALGVLAGGAVPELRLPWGIPGAELSLSMDPLSAFFLLLVFPVCLAAGVYGEGYLERGHLPAAYVRCFYFLITAAMAVLVCARNAVLFLAAWEVMALASFFLVSTEHGRPEVRRAGLLYLVCTHTGTLCLFVLFALMGARAGSLEFSAMRAEGPLLFALALAGFGLKAGFMPLHLWLQEAHPAAPSHVSAVLSGVVIKTGIYGLMRFLSLCPAPPESWGWALLAVGASSGVLGVLFALAQHDLKRLLAYHSVENIGIIAMGLGLGCLGAARGEAPLTVIGYAGAVLHVLNHGLFKSLLFLGAGAYARALGTRDLEAGGGLARRMPVTTLLSWVGAAAICGLPPLNGFVSEWLVYWGLFWGGARFPAFAAAALALIGGLAAACFTKAYGALTLGEPRTPAAAAAADPGTLMLAPMAFLAAACLAIGLVPSPLAWAAARAAAAAAGLPAESALDTVAPVLAPLAVIGGLGTALIALAALLWAWRARLVGVPAAGPTWGCGFTRPTPRMQYTASSYAQPLARVFAGTLMTEEELHAPAGYWPRQASFHSHTPDPALDRALLPASAAVERSLAVARRLQHGRLQYYLLYVLVFLIALLLWKL